MPQSSADLYLDKLLEESSQRQKAEQDVKVAQQKYVAAGMAPQVEKTADDYLDKLLTGRDPLTAKPKPLQPSKPSVLPTSDTYFKNAYQQRRAGLAGNQHVTPEKIAKLKSVVRSGLPPVPENDAVLARRLGVEQQGIPGAAELAEAQRSPLLRFGEGVASISFMAASAARVLGVLVGESDTSITPPFLAAVKQAWTEMGNAAEYEKGIALIKQRGLTDPSIKTLMQNPELAQRMLAAAVPLIGPMASHGLDQFKRGDVTGGLITATLLLAPIAGKMKGVRGLPEVPEVPEGLAEQAPGAAKLAADAQASGIIKEVKVERSSKPGRGTFDDATGVVTVNTAPIKRIKIGDKVGLKGEPGSWTIETQTKDGVMLRGADGSVRVAKNADLTADIAGAVEHEAYGHAWIDQHKTDPKFITEATTWAESALEGEHLETLKARLARGEGFGDDLTSGKQFEENFVVDKTKGAGGAKRVQMPGARADYVIEPLAPGEKAPSFKGGRGEHPPVAMPPVPTSRKGQGPTGTPQGFTSAANALNGAGIGEPTIIIAGKTYKVSGMPIGRLSIMSNEVTLADGSTVPLDMITEVRDPSGQVQWTKQGQAPATVTAQSPTTTKVATPVANQIVQVNLDRTGQGLAKNQDITGWKADTGTPNEHGMVVIKSPNGKEIAWINPEQIPLEQRSALGIQGEGLPPVPTNAKGGETGVASSTSEPRGVPSLEAERARQAEIETGTPNSQAAPTGATGALPPVPEGLLDRTKQTHQQLVEEALLGKPTSPEVQAQRNVRDVLPPLGERTTILRPLPPIAQVGENYRRPLSDFSNRVYRETSLERAEESLPTGLVSSDPGEVYVSNTPTLALGQGTNQGVLLEFDTQGLQAQVNRKPGWQVVYENGEAEFILRHHKQPDFVNNLRSVTVKPDAGGRKGAVVRVKAALDRLEQKGWTKTTEQDGSIKYTKPEGLPPVPRAEPFEMPPSERSAVTESVEKLVADPSITTQTAFDARVETARARLSAKREARLKGELKEFGSGGLSSEELLDLAFIGADHIRSGVREFSAWSSKMIEEARAQGIMDGVVKPHLAELWAKAHGQLEQLREKPAGQERRSLPETLDEHGLLGGTDRFYEVAPEQRSFDRGALAAAQVVAEKGLDGAVEFIRSNDVASPEQVSTAWHLIDRIQDEAVALIERDPARADALMAKAQEIGEIMSARLTRYGQTIDAVKTMEKLHPSRIVGTVQAIIDQSVLGRGRQLTTNEKVSLVTDSKEIQATKGRLRDAEAAQATEAQEFNAASPEAPPATTGLPEVPTTKRAKRGPSKSAQSRESLSSSDPLWQEIIDVERERLKTQRKKLAKRIEGFDKWGKFRRLVPEIVNFPKALWFAIDDSWSGRQGAIYFWNHPIKAGKTFGKTLKAFVQTPEGYHEMVNDLKADPMYEIAVKPSKGPKGAPTGGMGIDMTIARSEGGSSTTAGSDYFQSNLAERLPLGIGRLIRGSDQAFAEGGNHGRLSWATVYDRWLRKGGMTPESHPYEWKGAGEIVNVLTGRAPITPATGTVLGPFVNSARWVKSRVQLVNPFWYGRLALQSPRASAMLMKDMIVFTTGVVATLEGAAYAGRKMGLDAEADHDPESADFGKLRIGKTHYDLTGGAQQEVRFIAQLMKAQADMHNGFMAKDGQGIWYDKTGKRRASTLEIILEFGRRKLAPVPSQVVDYMAGETLDYTQPDEKGKTHRKPFSWNPYPEGIGVAGEKNIVPQGPLSLLVPGKLMLKNFEDAYQADKWKGVIFAGPETVGISTQTYKPGAAFTPVPTTPKGPKGPRRPKGLGK